MQGTHIFAVVLLTFGVGLSPAQSQSPIVTLVVVLRNDAVLIGQVTQTDQGISVRTNSGSTVELPFNQVAFLAESLDAAYEQLAAATDVRQAAELRRLFDWSLRNGLLRRCEELLVRAPPQSIDAQLLALMQRRLDDARREQSVPDANAVAAPDTARPASKQPSQKEIDSAIAALPQDGEAFFNQRLNAKLVAGCAAAKCHTRDHPSLAFWHDGVGRQSPRGYTRRNLYQVLGFVDRDHPGSSKLLEMALTAHGGQSAATFTRDDAVYRHLQLWSYAVSRYPDKYRTEVMGLNDAAPSIAVSDAPAPSEPGPIAQVGFVDDANVPRAPAQIDDQPERPNGAAALIDECDPNIFNRLHHGDGK